MFFEFDELDLGSGPTEEEVAQVGSERYFEKTRVEIAQFIAQLNRMFPIPEVLRDMGVRLKMKANSHDFGTYHTVIVRFPGNIPEAVEFAYYLESHTPAKWDVSAAREVLEDEAFLNRQSNPNFEPATGNEPEKWWQEAQKKTA